MNYISPPANLPPGSVVDVYLRDSGGEGQDRSVESQLTEVQKYFKQHKWVMGEIYKDAARSGKTTAGRAAFEKMLTDYETGTRKPGGLCIWDYARFARNSRDAVLHIARIEHHGIVIHSLTDNIPDGEYKDLLRLVKHMGNQAEREKNSAAVKRELHQLVDEKKAMFGKPPHGFKREPLPPTRNQRTGEIRTHHTWVPDATLAPLVLRAFEMRAEGSTSNEILTATGLYKSASCLPTFFANKLYKGVLEFGGKVIEDYCEPIVPPELWERVNAMPRTRIPGNNIHDPNRIRSTYLLSGLAHCQHCNGALNGHTIKDWSYYICATRKNSKSRECDALYIPKDKLEAAVIETIKDHALDLEVLVNLQAGINRELDTGRDALEARRASLHRTLADATREVNNLAAAIRKHGHSDALLAALAESEANKSAAAAQLNQLENEITLPRKSSAQLKEIAAAINHTLTHGTDQEKQTAIRTFVTRIIAHRKRDAIDALVYYVPIKIINPDDRGLLGLGNVPPRGFEPRS